MQSSFDAIGTVPFTETFFYDFKCELLPFANKWIRSHFWVDLYDPNYEARYELKSLDP